MESDGWTMVLFRLKEILMIPTPEQMKKMTLRQLESLLERCLEGSLMHATVGPFYRHRLARRERALRLISFIVPTAIALIALVRSFAR
jgi:hypothetical protein